MDNRIFAKHLTKSLIRRGLLMVKEDESKKKKKNCRTGYKKTRSSAMYYLSNRFKSLEGVLNG